MLSLVITIFVVTSIQAQDCQAGAGPLKAALAMPCSLLSLELLIFSNIIFDEVGVQVTSH